MMIQVLLALVMLVQAPTSRPATQPEVSPPATSSPDSYRRLWAQFEDARKQIKALQAELKTVREQNAILQKEYDQFKAKQQRVDQATVAFKLTPEQAAAFEDRRVIVGMPFAAVLELWKPLRPLQVTSDALGTLYDFRLTRWRVGGQTSSGIIWRSDGEVSKMRVFVGAKSQLVEQVEGEPLVPENVERAMSAP